MALRLLETDLLETPSRVKTFQCLRLVGQKTIFGNDDAELMRSVEDGSTVAQYVLTSLIHPTDLLFPLRRRRRGFVSRRATSTSSSAFITVVTLPISQTSVNWQNSLGETGTIR